jgi:hypothetical protein
MEPNEYQELLSGRDDVDNDPVGMTRYQAQKCAAIILAGRAGHTTYAEATATVAQYLQAIALDVLPGNTRPARSSASSGRFSMTCRGRCQASEPSNPTNTPPSPGRRRSRASGELTTCLCYLEALARCVATACATPAPRDDTGPGGEGRGVRRTGRTSAVPGGPHKARARDEPHPKGWTVR